MTDEEQIRRLLAEYCQFLDDRRYVEFGELFAPDGVWTLGGKDHHGPADVKAYMDRLLETHPNRRTKHMCMNIAVVMHDESADVSSDYMMFAHEGSEAWRTVGGGRYVDQVRRTSDGKWRFAHRTLLH